MIKEAKDFLVEMLLKVVVKRFLLSLVKNNFLRKLILKSTFITIIVEKWDTFNRFYARFFDNFQRKLTNLMNEFHSLKGRLLNENKRVSKKSSKIFDNGEVKMSTLN